MSPMIDRYDENGDAGIDLAQLGAHLRAMREAQGLSYDDVAAATHVRPHLLRAIENATIEREAAPIYARGFIKTYCEFLMAGDLWEKYAQSLGAKRSQGAGKNVRATGPVDIKHPTPMFRRSSIIWVYIVLILSVAGAGVLLWSQHNDPDRSPSAFFLRTFEESSPDVVSSDVAAAISEDLHAATFEPLSVDFPMAAPPLSADGAVARSFEPVARSADLSWMDGGTPDFPVAPAEPAVSNRDLLIRITGTNRLMVSAEGKYITRRNLASGDTRIYDVSNDVTVHFSAGNRADVTWYGKQYESAGRDGAQLSLTFSPDGRVRVVEGASAHF